MENIEGAGCRQPFTEDFIYTDVKLGESEMAGEQEEQALVLLLSDL